MTVLLCQFNDRLCISLAHCQKCYKTICYIQSISKFFYLKLFARFLYSLIRFFSSFVFFAHGLTDNETQLPIICLNVFDKYYETHDKKRRLIIGKEIFKWNLMRLDKKS